MNPYRDAFYHRQAAWHGYSSPEAARAKHELRAPYYAWYFRDWLPTSPSTPILDIACGSGQLPYFLQKQGHTDVTGIDLDSDQVALAQQLGLNCHVATIQDFLAADSRTYGLITMLDILEHFTREELFPLLETIVARLQPGGSLIASVPNALSPVGNEAIYADITHEIAFTPTSLAEMLTCHGLTVRETRDPWPAPIDLKRRLYRSVVLAMRKLESARYRLLGLEPPAIWSSVLWVRAEKQ
jgi:2-polyprenyl-3-methyl-5-hydroxy-6-metoxy-1,4-benzoquinol methylase